MIISKEMIRRRQTEHPGKIWPTDKGRENDWGSEAKLAVSVQASKGEEVNNLDSLASMCESLVLWNGEKVEKKICSPPINSLQRDPTQAWMVLWFQTTLFPLIPLALIVPSALIAWNLRKARLPKLYQREASFSSP